MYAPRQHRRVEVIDFARLASWLALSFWLSMAWAREPFDLPSPLLDTDHSSVEERLESLSESYKQVLDRMSELIDENETISRRLKSLESEPAKDDHDDEKQSPVPPFELQALYDSFHPLTPHKSKPWYEKLSIRGYSQIRLGRALTQDPNGAPPSMFSDRSISGTTGTFSIRRARLILSGDVSDHVALYFQSDFANNPADGTNTFFAQIRDLYADLYIDTDKVNRIRVGQSKLPWGFEEMQSSGNRIPLDRSDAIDSGDSPNQRDLGAFYYWTPVEKQKLLKDLVDGGLKGSGNYGIFALGFYNGQGGSQLDLNKDLYSVARLTWPHQLTSGQVVEVSIQGYSGKHVVEGAAITPPGAGAASVPLGVGQDGLRERRLAGTFVWYPQPIGLQAEWNVGEGPGLNSTQTAVEVRSLQGGYVMTMYKLDTPRHGIFFPFARYQYYKGGYRSIANSPYGTHTEYDFGVEWQIRKELELVVDYSFVNGMNLDPNAGPGTSSYQNFIGQVLRCQLQFNY